MPTSAVTRKRSRASLTREDAFADEDDELDELSPGRNSTAPLAGTKRRKLSSHENVGASATRLGSRLRKRIGGFSAGGKENFGGEGEGEDEDGRDELGDNGEDKDSGIAGDESIWEIQVSEPEGEGNTASTQGPRRGRSKTNTPKVTPLAKKGRGSANKDKGSGTGNESNEEPDIYAITDSEDKKGPKRPVASVEKAKAKLAARKMKSSIENTKTSPGRLKRVVADEEEPEEDIEEAQTPSRVRRNNRRNEESPVERSPEPEPPSTGRKRGRPRKDLDSILQSVKMDQPKSILTPSKKDRQLKSKKSVAFEKQGEEIDLGFKDLPDTSNKKTKKNKKETPPEPIEDSEDEDDTPCSICLKPDSTDENAIVYCSGEGCKTAVHQECYGLETVPEGDWWCRSCRPEEESDDPESEELEQEETEPPKDNSAPENPDDIACAVCSGLDSKAGNHIIICDQCEYSVHVKCYDLPKQPRGDWFCKDCHEKAEQEPLEHELNEEATLEETSAKLPDIDGFENHLRELQRILLDKLTGQKRVKLSGHEEDMQKVHQVVEQTIVAGEGNSMLVIGARGCGKTTLVESVISDLSVDHRESFHVVRLNGFIHTDDKLALKEIWRQLGREMEIEDDVAGKTTNYADTLASLLALLSHPSEISESHSDQTAKSVVFVLDEFDLFTTHPRQTLLYNLFDIAQARKAPIVVLGLTTRIDVVESLEKRVKSRFSHRYVYLSLPRSLPAFWEVCKQGITVNDEEFNSLDTGAAGQNDFFATWQDMIDDLYVKDTVFKNHVQSHFYRTKSVPAFFTSCILPIASLSANNFPLTGKKITSNIMSFAAPDSKLQTLQGLAELELALLIAAARLDIILDTDTCNFSMAYDEYSSLTSRHKIQTSSTGVTALGSSAKVWGRDIALGSWERLADYDLLVPPGIGGCGNRDTGTAGRMWKVDVGLEEIAGSVEGLSGVMAKWCREI